MNELLLCCLTHVFGKNGFSPKRQALSRLGIALAVAALIDAMLISKLGDMKLPTDLPAILLAVVTVITSQVVVALFVFLATLAHNSRRDGFLDQLMLLPLQDAQRWLVTSSPGLCLVAVILTLTAGPLLILAAKFHFSLSWLAASLAIGIVSGVAVGSYQPHKWLLVNLGLVASLIFTEVRLLEELFTHYQTSASSGRSYFYGLVFCVVSTFYWLLRSTVSWTEAYRRVQNRQTWDLHLPVPAPLWYLAKVARSPKLQKNAVVLISLSLGGTLLWLHSGQARWDDIGLPIMSLSFLATMSTADLRGTTRAVAAPEILTLRGTTYFVRQEFLAGLFLAFLVTAPILAALTVLGAHHPFIILQAGCQIVLGMSAATLTGTLFVPSPQDVAAQFLSIATASLCLFAFERLSDSWALNSTYQVFGWVGISLLWLLVSWRVEMQRNHYYWKGDKHVRTVTISN